MNFHTFALFVSNPEASLPFRFHCLTSHFPLLCLPLTNILSVLSLSRQSSLKLTFQLSRQFWQISGKHTSSFSKQGRQDAMPKAQALHYKDYQCCFNLGFGALKYGLKIDMFSQFKDLYKLIRISHRHEAEFSQEDKNTHHAPKTRQTHPCFPSH